MKTALKYIALPIACALIGSLLLMAAAFVPQTAVEKNALEAANEIVSQGEFPSLISDAQDFTVYLDNYTDQLILMESYTLNGSDLSSVLLNPYYMPENGTSHTAFYSLLAENAEANIDYVRYWQGFRIFVRPLLAMGSYFDILEVSAIAFFLLFALSTCLAAKKHGMTAALLFALSVAFFKPAVIAFSLQYVCCFLLMFIFSAIVLCCDIKPEKAPFLFVFFGIATQFFDFYTTPPITFAIPLLFLLLSESYRKARWITVFKTFLAWVYGYISMWIVKLAMVGIFTDVNGFADGFSSVSSRVGGAWSLSEYISALKYAWWLSSPGENELLIFACLVLMMGGGALLLLLRKGFKPLLSCASLLTVAAIPIPWIACSPQAMNIHAWFQHRSMLPLFTGIFMFSLLCIRESGFKFKNQ